MKTFDICGPLPTGTTLLEASAGTGKTYTIGALVTRYVAEGAARLDQILVITFSRAASQELRERVRQHLAEADRAFERGASTDALHQLLLDGNAGTVEERHQRVRDALANFDAATIATTHQFCELVRRSLGVAGDSDTSARFVESLADLTQEVVDDLYLKTFGGHDTADFNVSVARQVARAAVEDPHAELADADPKSVVGVARVEFARQVRAELSLRKRRGGLLSYDDMLSQVRDALAVADSPAAQRMRERWRIVLVDEFQDTDPVQWDVLDLGFRGHSTLVLIGDPKQAIYGFRGGDVVTYLRAAETTSEQHALGKNWRSDPGLIARLNDFLSPAELGDQRIAVHPVQAAHAGPRLEGAPRPEPLRLRQVGRGKLPRSNGGSILAAAARQFVATDCAADIAELLTSTATWDGRKIAPGDVAVLVAKRTEGALIQEALRDRGIPAVFAGGDDVFSSEAGDDWLTLLKAMESPQRGPLVRAAALGPFFNVPASEVAQDPEGVAARAADALRSWAALMRTRGIAGVMEAAEEAGLGARTLARVDGDRLITDLRHLGESLHHAATVRRLGLTALIHWFSDERSADRKERPRRLESDAQAVQIMTLFASKGLEFPVVHVPFAFDFYRMPTSAVRFHDAAGLRRIDVSGSGSTWNANKAQAEVEEDGEELRKLYVALTRAQSQVVMWWAPSNNAKSASLHRLLFGRMPGSGDVLREVPVGQDQDAAARFAKMTEVGWLSAEAAVPAAAGPFKTLAETPELSARRFNRTLDTVWRRTSYSGLVRAAEEAGPAVSSEPAADLMADEPDELADETPVNPDDLAPIGRLPRGATFGSLVHAVLEHADPQAEDLLTELAAHAAEQLRWWPVDVTPDQLAEALLPVYDTDLGPVAEGLTLREVGFGDRLRELDFEFPLAGGDRPIAAEEVRLRDLASVLREHLAADDPMRAYADVLETTLLGEQALRGYLSGSIDVVLRLPSGRFVIADYKTNFLGTGLPEEYEPQRLAEAMLHSHYPLQAMLYSVVLHRYLSLRLPGYVPQTHLGGVQYYYLRGMTGVDATGGVFSWTPSAALVTALSDTLGGGAHA
ncbi:RecBCD enzyme subunit RecB [Nocardioides baekrokdamisoli]|uniref:RecBCD enzyme subunit RecB n=1 Tax=Nocardioides baekrokdamisoli TaxID=1804624 RepID=A0A3G9IF08_9ACTN|nr:UvrD-helicase domain-containing protein [Nocardioides baekrokdamisoli]BBH17580.1 RecBCD enzyme subunit RecB [Nocardioides baekrokdamisoli]